MSSKILPILELDELAELFDYPSLRQVKRAIRNGTFPIPLFKLGKRYVAHVDAVELWFNQQREGSMTWMQRRHKLDPEDVAATEPRLDLLRKKRAADIQTPRMHPMNEGVEANRGSKDKYGFPADKGQSDE